MVFFKILILSFIFFSVQALSQDVWNQTCSCVLSTPHPVIMDGMDHLQAEKACEAELASIIKGYFFWKTHTVDNVDVEFMSGNNVEGVEYKCSTVLMKVTGFSPQSSEEKLNSSTLKGCTSLAQKVLDWDFHTFSDIYYLNGKQISQLVSLKECKREAPKKRMLP